MTRSDQSRDRLRGGFPSTAELWFKVVCKRLMEPLSSSFFSSLSNWICPVDVTRPRSVGSAWFLSLHLGTTSGGIGVQERRAISCQGWLLCRELIPDSWKGEWMIWSTCPSTCFKRTKSLQNDRQRRGRVVQSESELILPRGPHTSQQRASHRCLREQIRQNRRRAQCPWNQEDSSFLVV